MARSVDIALLSGLVKDLRGSETFAPAQVDMRNVRVTDAGNMVKRPGYAEWRDTGVDFPVVGLIPEDNGYAITENGSIYTLDSGITNIHSSATWQNLPTWTKYKDQIIIAYGGHPLSIVDNVVSYLGGNPPLGSFVENISSYTILAGYDDRQFRWSEVNNPNSWPSDHTADIQATGTLLNMIEYKDRLLMFKERETEMWNFVGGADPFVRYPGGKIFQGLLGKNSVVKANDRVYWFGSDGDLYVYEGGSARVISDKMRRRLDEMNSPDAIIGIDIPKEHLIMWLNPVDGMTILYDYSKDLWLEDARWGRGWQSLPFSSYMEFNRKQYVGSRNCDGKVHEWSEDYRDDDGQAIRVFRSLRVSLASGDNQIRMDSLLLRREGSMATASVTSPVMQIRYRWDAGQWSNWRQETLGMSGKHNPYAVELRSLGVGRDFELEIQHSDATDFVMTNAIATFTELM